MKKFLEYLLTIAVIVFFVVMTIFSMAEPAPREEVVNQVATTTIVTEKATIATTTDIKPIAKIEPQKALYVEPNTSNGTITPYTMYVALSKDRVLKPNADLTARAQKRANEIQTWSHDGYQAYFQDSIYNAPRGHYGENLARNFNTAQEVETAFMNSPTHKANILKQSYSDVGIGVNGSIIVVFFGGIQ